jgi:hypothetical protein
MHCQPLCIQWQTFFIVFFIVELLFDPYLIACSENVSDFCRKESYFALTLTYSTFETGAYEVPSKSQNPTVLGQGGPYSTQYSLP